MLVTHRNQGTKFLHHFNTPYKASSRAQGVIGFLLHKTRRDWEINIKSSFNKDKVMHTEAHGNGENFHYHFLTLNVFPHTMLHNCSKYSPQMGNGGSDKSISRNMEG